MWEDQQFRIRLEDHAVLDYERTMLSSGQCDFFMPMGFLGDEDGETACYDCSGFAPLDDYRIERTEDALYLLERTLIILGNAPEYLITPSRITLTTSTVFYNKDTGQVKIAYYPATEDSGGLRGHLAAFIEQLKADIKDGREEYLTEAVHYVCRKNYQIADLITKVALFKRQIYAQNTM